VALHHTLMACHCRCGDVVPSSIFESGIPEGSRARSLASWGYGMVKKLPLPLYEHVVGPVDHDLSHN
jgi:hypothetical protein